MLGESLPCLGEPSLLLDNARFCHLLSQITAYFHVNEILRYTSQTSTSFVDIGRKGMPVRTFGVPGVQRSRFSDVFFEDMVALRLTDPLLPRLKLFLSFRLSFLFGFGTLNRGPAFGKAMINGSCKDRSP